jgi:hypothetical protein
MYAKIRGENKVLCANFWNSSVSLKGLQNGKQNIYIYIAFQDGSLLPSH